MSRFVIFVLALLPPASGALAQAWPAPFEAEYTGSKFPFGARATIRLARLGDYYRYSMRGSVHMAFFRVTETYDCSVLQVRDGELYPSEYVHRDSRDSRRDLHTRFDWSSRTARTTRGDGAVVEVDGLPHVAWDAMSIQMRLRADAPAGEGGGERDYAVVEKGVLTRHRAKRAGAETIEVAGIPMNAAKMVVESRKRVNQFWFAPDYAWLPVRLLVSGVTLELTSSPEQAARPAGPAAETPPSCE